MYPLSVLLLAAAALVDAAPAIANGATDVLAHIKRAESHEVVALFKRQARNYPPAGSVPDRANTPQAWLDKLGTLSLPNIPIATGTPLPQYAGRQPTDREVCSFTYECDHPEDLKEPAPGRLAFTFDDGPAEGTDALWTLLDQQNIEGGVTHFMIGSYISRNPSLFERVAQGGGHIGVHTWSHTYMTTLTNEQVVAELGWCMQIQADHNGGRVPMYWRPPYGDVDNRVRAIAKGVFGLETVTWSQDTGDWNLDQGGSTTVQSITNMFGGWLGDKSRGLNVLEHEVRPSQIEVFRNIYPRAQQQGWTTGNVAQVWNRPWYQNAQNATGAVVPMSVGAARPSLSAGGSASASASASRSGNASASGSASSARASDGNAGPSGANPSPSRSASASASSVSTAGAGASASASPRPSSAAMPLALAGSGMPGAMAVVLGAVVAMVL